jgi:class 3 adenylate cyclase
VVAARSTAANTRQLCRRHRAVPRIVGSTELTKVTDPEEVDRLLRRYRGLAREAIERYGGTIRKFIGDAVVALFGFPLAHADYPERAIRAAVDIVELIRADEIGLRVRVAVEAGWAFIRDATQASYSRATAPNRRAAGSLTTGVPDGPRKKIAVGGVGSGRRCS